jgi:hypothetical protein
MARIAAPSRSSRREENDMSAPQTNIETQKRRHRGPLIGMAVAVLFGVMLIVYWLLEESATADNPQGSEDPAQTEQPAVEDVNTGTPPVPDASGSGTAPTTPATSP